MSTLQNTAAACLEADSASKLLLIIAKDVVGTLIAITVVLSMCSGYNPNQGIWIHKGLAAQYGLQFPPAITSFNGPLLGFKKPRGRGKDRKYEKEDKTLK